MDLSTDRDEQLFRRWVAGPGLRQQRGESHRWRRRAQIHSRDGGGPEFVRHGIRWQQADRSYVVDDSLLHAFDTCLSPRSPWVNHLNVR